MKCATTNKNLPQEVFACCGVRARWRVGKRAAPPPAGTVYWYLMIPFLPVWYSLAATFVFGVIIGSFLNVVIYRFHTGKSLSGSSHCLSCQVPLRFFDLFPLVSYLVLRGRCRRCSARIPSRYFWVELLTGVLFLLTALTAVWWLWVPLWCLMAVLVVVLVYDLAHLIIPDSLTYTVTALASLYVGYLTWLLLDPTIPLFYLTGALGAYGFFAGLWWYSGGQWIGYGDAKLAAPLAFMLGPVGAFSLVVLSFWIGAILSLGLLGVQWLRRRWGKTRLPFSVVPLTMKSEVPFAPFLILAFWLVFFWRVDVLTIISYAL